jgi:hypothetical protein
MSIETRLDALFPDTDPRDVRARILERMRTGEMRCFRTWPTGLPNIRYILSEDTEKFLKAYPKAVEIPANVYEFMVQAEWQQVQ